MEITKRREKRTEGSKQNPGDSPAEETIWTQVHSFYRIMCGFAIDTHDLEGVRSSPAHVA